MITSDTLISVRFRLSESEFMAASNASWSAQRQGSMASLVLGAAVFAGGAAIGALFSRWIGVVCLVLGALVMLMVWVRSRLWRRAFGKMRKYEDEVSFTFAEGGLTTETIEGSASIGWDFYQWFLDTPDFLLLYADRRSFTVIPKKAFADGESGRRVLTLVEEKLEPLP
jgi:hypothetical protein